MYSSFFPHPLFLDLSGLVPLIFLTLLTDFFIPLLSFQSTKMFVIPAIFITLLGSAFAGELISCLVLLDTERNL